MLGRINIDFVRPPAAVPLRAALLLAAGLLAVTAVLLHAAVVERAASRLAATRDMLGRRPAPVVTTSAAEASAQAAALSAAQRVARQLNQPWSQLFNTLENVRQPGVTLMSIQPGGAAGGGGGGGGEGRRFTLIVQAPRYRAALDYVAALAGMPGLASAHLVAHEMLSEAGGAAVQFTVQLDWEPAR